MKVGDFVFVYGTLTRGGKSDLSKHQTLQFIDTDHVNGSLADFGFLQERRPVLLRPCTPEYDGGWYPWYPYIQGDVLRIRHESIIPLLDAFARCPETSECVVLTSRYGRKVFVYSHIIEFNGGNNG